MRREAYGRGGRAKPRGRVAGDRVITRGVCEIKVWTGESGSCFSSLHEVDFAFSAPVTSSGGVGNEQIVIVAGGEPNTSSSAEQVSAMIVRFWFESVTEAGDAWTIENVPDGLDFHGAGFGVPQGGVVE